VATKKCGIGDFLKKIPILFFSTNKLLYICFKKLNNNNKMETTKSSTLDQFDFIKKINDETAISILIQDLKTSSKLQTEEGEKLLLRLSKVLTESYLEKERNIITKFAFDFYADLSRQMKVPENLISENLTWAELYFEEKFNQNKDV